MPPKKATAGVTVLLIDAGMGMAEKNAFQQAITTADWIVSRKLFSEDPEKFAVMAFNLDPKEHSTEIDFEEFKGVSLHDEEFRPASFDHLRFITKEVKLNEKLTEPNFFKGVLSAVSLIKSGTKSSNPSGITLIVLTNGMSENLRQESIDLLVDAVTEATIDLMVIGLSEDTSSRISEIVEAVEGRSYTFENVSRMLSTFQARQKSERKFNKMWDIAPGIRLPVTIALKSEKSSALLKFKNVDATGNEMVRMEEMHVEAEEDVKPDVFMSGSAKADPESSSFVKSDSVKPDNGKTKKVVEKTEKLLHGYNFGKSLIMMDPEYLQEKYNNHNFNEGQTGGVLKLIQFTKRANILDSYLLDASAKTVLPSVSTSSRVLSATVSLIEAMLSLRVAAICRFTFHAKSHVQLVALLPHKNEETGVLYLRSVKLPFSDDMRTLKFPKFSFEEEEEVDSGKPTLAQLSAVDDLIDSMQLKEGEIANLVEGGMSDPKLQMQCHFLKSIVLHPEDPLSTHSSRTTEIVDEIMAPKKRVEAENAEIFQRLGREFSLHTVVKTKRERVQVEAEDLESMISEWKDKKRQKTSDDGKEKKKAKLSRREEIEMEMREDAGQVCTKMLQMISNMCKFEQNGAVTGFFQLLLSELEIVRSVSVSNGKCEEFNELLKKLREEEEFEPFAEYLAEEKSCNPIANSEISKSEFSDSEAAEFWEEN